MPPAEILMPAWGYHIQAGPHPLMSEGSEVRKHKGLKHHQELYQSHDRSRLLQGIHMVQNSTNPNSER